MDFEQLRRFERINVVGTSGSGKSTFARELAEVLSLPCCEMDQLFWRSNWQESSDEEFFRKVREVTAQHRWVLDGNYTRTTRIKWEHVQLVIWLDLPFVETVVRVSKRAIRRILTQQELWPGTGNRESIARCFLSTKSIIWWAATTHRRNRRKYCALMTSPEYSHIHFLQLRTPRSVADCLDGLRRVTERSPAREAAAL